MTDGGNSRAQILCCVLYDTIKIGANRLYSTYCLFAPMIEVTLLASFHEKSLKEIRIIVRLCGFLGNILNVVDIAYAIGYGVLQDVAHEECHHQA